MKPQPDFTIADLLRETITQRQEKEEDPNLFRVKELRDLWGFSCSETVYQHMDRLEEAGWKFTSAKKRIVNRAGITTHVSAYRVMPPNEETLVE